MKYLFLILSATALFSTTAFASSPAKATQQQYISECMQTLVQTYRSISTYALKNCQGIKNEHSLSCIKSLAANYRSVTDRALNNCRNFKNTYATEAFHTFTGRFRSITDKSISIIAKVDSEASMVCIQSLTRYSNISDADLKTCLF